MKLRRALTAVATTAVIAPAALMAAPIAYAEENPSSANSASGTPTPGASTSTSPNTEPSDGQTTTSAPGNKPGDKPGDKPGNTPSSSTDPSSTATAPSTAPGKPSESGSTSPAPSASEPSEEPSDECEVASDEAAITTTLHGLPTKVVAGSGWHGFTFRATNVSEQKMKSVDAYIHVGAIDKDKFDDVSGHLTVQWYDADEGRWQDVDDEFGYFASLADLEPGEYSDAKMRLKVDAKMPGSYGFAFAIGTYQDAENTCGTTEVSDYEFDVLVAGSKPGPVDDAKGKPSKQKPVNQPAPQGGLKELPVTGKLADTGSSDALPTIAIAGGAAVAVGVGAMFLVRRRKNAGSAA
ncbi:LPXTG cell wall anchor domain-containing protein [Streptomyces sp. NPDC003077]|uniref:LPXTG cell wall anchor domain-containing protein n=1 Tax=Streptomyces sp. NPDC003077 TaxID=3154443 RepID=UPI0033ABE462